MTLQIEYRPIASLRKYAHNAKKHDQTQIDQLRAVYRNMGFVNPVLVDAEGEVIAGHGRIEAAELEGFKELPTITLGHLSEAQKRAFRLAENKLQEGSAWDYATLAGEILRLQSNGFDMELTGFSPTQLKEITEGPEPEDTDTDEPEDSGPKTISCPKCGHTQARG